MYYDYFGLKQPPFKITPDTSLFFPGGNRGAVLEALIYAITQGEGIVKVVGEVGAGKTMLCRMLQVELPDNVEVVYLVNPSLSPENILHAIAFELKLKITEKDNRLKVMNKLQKHLLNRHAKNKQVVVFVEEAQGMPIATLEEIRLLSNLETTQNKLLQIVLFGQPELDEKIATREIRQLKERITYSFQLAPFKKDDVKDYLNSRMRTCGYRSDDVFAPSAVIDISKYSKGLIRRINILADKALLAAYAGNTHKVTSSHVKIAARDSEFIKSRIFLTPALVSMAVLVFVVLLGGIVFPEKISQGINTIQKSFDINVKPGNKQVLQESTSTGNQALTALVSEDAVYVKPTHDLSNSVRLNENIQAIDGSVSGNSMAEEQIETIYLPQDGEAMSISEVAEEDRQSGGMSMSDEDVLELARLIRDNEIGSLSELKKLLEDGDTVETIYLSENEDLPLLPSEPVAIGLTEQEFERFKQQLVVVPPEVDLDGSSGDVCERCASIIYRPIL